MSTVKVAVWDVRFDKNGNSRITVKIPRPNGASAVASYQHDTGSSRETFAKIMALNLAQEVYPHTADHGHGMLEECDVAGHGGGFAFRVF